MNSLKLPQLIFTYGTLCRNHGNHACIAHSTTKFLGEIKTAPSYTLMDGGVPVVERGGETSITGELFEVNDKNVLTNVYGLEGYKGEQHHPRNWYDTDTLTVTVDGVEREALIFVMDKGKSGRKQIVKSGKWF